MDHWWTNDNLLIGVREWLESCKREKVLTATLHSHVRSQVYWGTWSTQRKDELIEEEAVTRLPITTSTDAPAVPFLSYKWSDLQHRDIIVSVIGSDSWVKSGQIGLFNKKASFLLLPSLQSGDVCTTYIKSPILSYIVDRKLTEILLRSTLLPDKFRIPSSVGRI